ncbi:MAG: NAD(P)-dependent oxidoreductase, partial [Rhizobiaceae bacterium]|nr:NAD(P)-dependent oxidoreductase [Rhizobiaceae bacterium]
MSARTFLILGAGYSGKAFARTRREGERVFGTTRSVGNFPTLRACGIEPLLFDGERVSPELTEAIAAATHVVASAA